MGFLIRISWIGYSLNNRIHKNNKELYICPWCHRYHKINNKFKNFCSKRCYNKYQNEKNQIFKHNNRCKYHKSSNLSYKNECWLCWKKSFSQFVSNSKLSLIWKIRLFLDNWKKINTFRTSTENWSRDKSAFEQSLLDKHIKWFVYIKLYVNQNGKSYPIVIGKSGSLKANSSGSDVNFSTDINDGAARQFLYRNKLCWNYDYIYIKKCNSEKKAYKIERKYSNLYKLLGS